MRQYLGDEPCRSLEPPGHVCGRCEEAGRLTERQPVELLHLPAQGPVLGRRPELAELGPVELVRLTELVDEPDALLGMPDDVGGELRGDHHVDRPSVGLRQVEHPPEERLRQNPSRRGTT